MRWVATAALVASACSAPAPSTHVEPAEVSHAIAETDLPTVRLTPETIERLRIETTVVREASSRLTRLVGGEVVVPPGRSITVTAPVAGELRFVSTPAPAPGAHVEQGAVLLRLLAIAPADRDTRARIAREVAAAEANLAALELRVTRNQALVNQQSGSVRALEEAIAARDVAMADLAAARARVATLSRGPLLSDVWMSIRAPSNGVIRQLTISEGQSVPAGAPLFEVVSVDTLQVRVPIYSADLSRLDIDVPANIRASIRGEPIEARLVSGPPTADPERNTVDRFFALPANAGLVPGERVLVDLPLRQDGTTLAVPASAVVFDAWGGAWVYRCDERSYIRSRVDPLRRVGATMLLARGPNEGTCVVSTGAVELLGIEFPPGH